MPTIPPGPPRPSSGLDKRATEKLIIDALLEAQKSAGAPVLLLKPSGVHWLGELYRHEVISALRDISAKNPQILVIIPDNHLQNPTKETRTSLTAMYDEKQWWAKWRDAPDDAPILLGLLDDFENWRAAQVHKRNTTLRTISEESRQKVWDTVYAIHEQFELSSNPKVTIYCNYTHINKTPDARRLALEFLTNKDAVNHYKFNYFTGAATVEVEINIQEFFKIRNELITLYAPAEEENAKPTKPLSPSDALASMEHLRWEEITIQFVDGHNVRISARDTKVIADFKQMGFEDARRRMPNVQWDFLQLLAKGRGELAWDSSEASDNLKKRKQVLAETLKAFFHIDDDPFHPYRDEKAYRLRFPIKAEGD